MDFLQAQLWSYFLMLEDDRFSLSMFIKVPVCLFLYLPSSLSIFFIMPIMQARSEVWQLSHLILDIQPSKMVSKTDLCFIKYITSSISS